MFSSLRAVAKQFSAQCKPSLDCFAASASRNDERSRSRDAVRARGILHASRKVPPTKAREAERRMAHPVPVAAPDERAQQRSDKRDRSPFGAPLRSCAEDSSPQLGPGRASWNHRIQTGGPSPAPVQRAPRGPPPGGGRDDAQAACEQKVTNSARKNRTRSVSRRLRLTSLTMSGMARCYSNLLGGVKGIISCAISADKIGS
jgi:hypothetical protein